MKKKIAEMEQTAASEAANKLISLFDEDSFVELGKFVGANGEKAGVVSGYGYVDGAVVYAYAQDISVNAGAVDTAAALKIRKVYELALRNGAPVVGIFDSKGGDIKEGMNRYFRGQTLVAFCVGVLFSIGFLIIDFPLAIGLGMLIGLLNLVPYLQVIGFVPTLLLAVLKTSDTGGNFWLILGSALLVFVVVQIIQDGFLVPRIMGKVTGLNPAIILLSLSIWGSLLGMIGMIIALPLTTLMLSYYRRYIILREEFQLPTEEKQPENRVMEEK